MNTNEGRRPIQKSTEPFTIRGDWAKYSKILKDKFSQLTDADLKFDPGREKDLLDRLERRLSKKRDELIFILTSLYYGNDPFQAGASL
jgi:hypothetical protein